MMADGRSSNVVGTIAGAGAILGVVAATAAVAMVWAGDADLRRQAVVFAAAVAGGGAIAGWLVASWTRGRGAAVATAGGLAATLVRFGPMLVALGWISTQNEDLRSAGAGEMLVIFYLPLLATDIVMTLLLAPGNGRNRGANASN